MKLIIAYIQPDRLNPVKQALYARNIFKISVTNALGCGQQRGYVHMASGGRLMGCQRASVRPSRRNRSRQ